MKTVVRTHFNFIGVCFLFVVLQVYLQVRFKRARALILYNSCTNQKAINEFIEEYEGALR